MASSLLPAGRKLVTATLPGLLHFGVEPIRLSPMFLTDKVRLYIPDREILNLEKVTIVGPGADRLARATCVLSSTHKSSAAPEALLDGKAIHTEREAYPYWELTFDAPQEVQEIEIGNRLGIWGGRSHGLCVDLFAPSNNVWRFDNANPDVLHLRLGDFIARVRDLAHGLAGLPEKLRITQAPKRTEVLRTAGALIDLAQQIIGGGAAVADHARGVRAKVVAAVVAAGTGVSGPAAADIIRLSARVLDFLLERSDRPRAAAFTEAETNAVGIVFAARFIAKGRVELGLVRENEIFLGTTEATRAVETLVNDLYKSTGADPLVLPIMFRSHGMSGAELRLNAPKFVASMKEVAEMVAENTKRYATDSRTFVEGDATSTPLPKVDLMIVRDLMLHIRLENSLAVLRNFVASGTPLLLASSYPVPMNKNIEGVGQYDSRPINLRLEPFSLPEPVEKLRDWVPGFTKRHLGLWRREDVAAAIA